MRLVGKVADEPSAKRFTAYLVTRGIDAVYENLTEGFAVWIRDEKDVALGRDEFANFLVAPNDPKYLNVEAEAAKLRETARKQTAESQENVVAMGQRWGRTGGRPTPITFALIAACVAVTLWTKFGANEDATRMIQFVEFTHLQSADGSIIDVPSLTSIKLGEYWRLITPIFLHLDAPHLIFNCYWLFLVGTQLELRKGGRFLITFVVVTAVISNFAQATMETPNFGGFSGVGYAMFGYAWMKSKFSPGSGIFIDPRNVVVFVAWAFIGFFMKNVAVTAHFAGLGAGVVWGYWPNMFGRRHA